MGLFESIERLIAEHGSAAILKERLSLAAEKYSALEQQNLDLKRQISKMQAEVDASGHLPLRFDLNAPDTELIDDEESFLESVCPLRLGFGIRLFATSQTAEARSDQLLALATKWLPFGNGRVRSGWLFHAWYPVGVPNHTFLPRNIYSLNSRHAVLFFKVHVNQDGTGYIHLLAASDHVCTLKLETTMKERLSGEFSSQSVGMTQRTTDVWTFTCDYAIGEEA